MPSYHHRYLPIRHLFFLVAVCGTLLSQPAWAQPKAVAAINWPEFMKRQDMVWNGTLPTAWTNGPFMGNGLLGVSLYVPPDSNAVRIDLGRTDYEDHRDSTEKSMRYPRLPIGYFVLRPVGRIQGRSKMRLDLYNAETRATIVTDRGSIQLRAYVHAEKMLVVLELTTTGAEGQYTFAFRPAAAISPRQQFGIEHHQPYRTNPNYRLNPPPVLGRFGPAIESGQYCSQSLLFGGQLTTAWRTIPNGSGRAILINATATYPATTATALATAAVQPVTASQLLALAQRHRRWWHAYYPSSFVSLPDGRLESFYWIQMYKLASATRADRPLIDDQGPWLQPTPWPYATWNLNVQLSYWPVYAANRLALGESLVRQLWKQRATLAQNIAPAYRKNTYGIGRATGTSLRADVDVPDGKNAPEIGDLTWACHNVYLHYRHAMRPALLRDTLYPLLRGSINYYLQLLTPDATGQLHLPRTTSPEYEQTSQDMNYDLALLRWGCQTLLTTNEQLQLRDTLAGKWQAVLTHLVPYPIDSTGFMVGKDLPLSRSHRHYSHLLMAYPLYTVNVEQPGGRALIGQSLAHWQSLKEALLGFSCTGAASLAAALGQGDAALAYLNGLWNVGFMQPNTLYQEDGPVIETPLSGAQAIHDMLLQSWGNKLRVFPAVPGAWANVAYANLSAEGGFLVSAVRKRGQTQWVTVTSRAGEPCLINPGIAGAVTSSNGGKLTALPGGFYKLLLKKGQSVTLFADAGQGAAMLPVALEGTGANYYGAAAMADKAKLGH